MRPVSTIRKAVPSMSKTTLNVSVARTRSVLISGLFILLVGLGLLTGCAADRSLRTPDVSEAIRAILPPATATQAVAVPAHISDALAEPAPPLVPILPEPKLDLLVQNAPAREVFLSLVTDTRYSMLMHPDVAGSLSLTLRGVTVLETLEAIRDVYGYDFKMVGRRITVFAPTLQTRIFTINYPNAQRRGTSSLRVASGGLQTSTGSTSNNSSNSNSNSNSNSGSTGVRGSGENSSVYTTSLTDFWDELANAVRSILGEGEGTNVTISPQSGIMVVRAMPDELRQVDKFLKQAQIAVERQVMLEVKIIEVELHDGFQSGIDWSALRSGGVTGALGVMSGNTTSNTLVSGVESNLPGFSDGGNLLENGLGLPGGGTGMFGLALAANGFQAVLGFLETRGDVQILSSPRIATLNNQKALLKVGTDEFFVTNVSGGTQNYSNTTGNQAPSIPSLSLTPFFSGISLDVTPQIDSANNITLHVRPSVTSVSEKVKDVDLGEVGNYRLPLASSAVNEFDTMVRIQDGDIVAIGGLMQLESRRRASGLPGSSSSLLGNRVNSGRKRELVVLIKPTIIRDAEDWAKQTRRTRDALDDMDVARARVIRINGTVDDARPKSPIK